MLKTIVSDNEEEDEDFLYFAYGSNMSADFMHLSTPSAEFFTIGRLDNYRLDFIKYSKFWGGPTMTMVPTANAHIWGVVWKVNKNELISLDDLKRVDAKKYYAKSMSILTPHQGALQCRCYEQRVNPQPRGDRDPVPVGRWPSYSFLRVAVAGARAHQLPPYYVRALAARRHNGAEGSVRAVLLARRYASQPLCACAVPGKLPREPLKWTRKSNDDVH